MIRLGSASAGGDTFCAVIVADSTVVGNVGTAYQSVNEGVSNDAARGWAHCGMHAAAADRDIYAPAGAAADSLLTSPTGGYSAPAGAGSYAAQLPCEGAGYTWGITAVGADGVGGTADDTVAFCR